MRRSASIRTEGGFRQYGGDVETLAFIRRVQGLIQTERDSKFVESAGKPFAAVRTGAASVTSKAHRCTKEARRPEVCA
jgi:hypothetical protein